jgi:tRNA A37 methylthiotransferase MiaB
LLALHEKEEKLCPHIHMPLQSGSNSILKKMFRGYTVEQAKECIDTIRKLKRNISITTDIIVGFCDETEEDFQQTLDLIKY